MNMQEKARPNLKIIGDNSASGGKYYDARVIGNSVVSGDLECVNFKSVGDSTINGNIRADNMKTVGSIAVTGSAKSGELVVTGDLKVSGDVSSNRLVIRGGISTRGNLKSGSARLFGHVTVNKNCDADSFRAEGQIRIDGLLNADEIEIKNYGSSKISEIGGNIIAIRKGPGLRGKLRSLFAPSGWGNAAVNVNTIEGDDVRLWDTRAKVVRGKNVVIESGCDIGLVEYEESLSVHRSSSVKEKKKV